MNEPMMLTDETKEKYIATAMTALRREVDRILDEYPEDKNGFVFGCGVVSVNVDDSLVVMTEAKPYFDSERWCLGRVCRDIKTMVEEG